jgi:hypothetical protein
MNRILTCGLFFNLHREAPFYQSHTIHIITKWGVHIMYKKNIPLLGKVVLAHDGKSPSPLVPCLKSTAFLPLALPSPLYPLPANRTFIYIQTTLTRLLLLLGTVILTQSSRAKVIYIWPGLYGSLQLKNVFCKNSEKIVLFSLHVFLQVFPLQWYLFTYYKKSLKIKESCYMRPGPWKSCKHEKEKYDMPRHGPSSLLRPGAHSSF